MEKPLNKLSTLKELHKSLKQRKRPEDVAQMILEIEEENLTFNEKAILNNAAQFALKNNEYNYTSMSEEFADAVGAEKQILKAMELFKLENNNSIDYNYLDDIDEFIRKISPLLQKEVGNNNFLSDRLNKTQRKENGLELSKKGYNKRWRLLKRLENKLKKFAKESKKVEFQKIGKHGLSHKIGYEEFKKDLHSASFIAYYNARCNLRSVFAVLSQERPYDEIADMLLNRCFGMTEKSVEKPQNVEIIADKESYPSWLAIAHIYSSQEVLDKLTDEQKGELLGKWTNTLEELSIFLSELWEKSDIDRRTMIVKRGNDSSTWNNTASAWNKARDNWMNIIYSLRLDKVLDELCFGKVLRLMAGDVAYWHKKSGGGIHPDSYVWNKIPLPWEVFQGKEKCNKEMVVRYCKEAGIDPEKSGWIAPRVVEVAEYKPTPELVHGVAISSPFLATFLKRHKFFSGKNVKK